MSERPIVWDMIWRNKNLTANAENIDDMIASLEMAARQLRDMRDSGVILDPTSRVGSDLARLITTNEEVAEEFDMQPDDREDRLYFSEIEDVEFEDEREHVEEFEFDEDH